MTDRRQLTYEAGRRDWRTRVDHWLATRELPGAPPPIEPPEEIMAALARPAHPQAEAAAA